MRSVAYKREMGTKAFGPIDATFGVTDARNRHAMCQIPRLAPFNLVRRGTDLLWLATIATLPNAEVFGGT